MLVSIRMIRLTQQSRKVCIKTRSPSASLPSVSVKWPIVTNQPIEFVEGILECVKKVVLSQDGISHTPLAAMPS